jgi:AraC family transcriptional regulator
MIISVLPDPQKDNNNSRPGQSGNTILYAYTREKYYYPPHATPYLFATNFINKGQYLVNNQPVFISERCFYLLNPNDELAITFNDALPLKTLFVFFNEEFVNECFYSLNNSDEHLLEKPFDKCAGPLAIPSVPFHLNQAISNIISLLIQGRINQQEIDANLFSLIVEFMNVNYQLKKLNAIKKTTKEELYKRLFVAKEFMKDNAMENGLTIDEIAKEACMSKFHFLEKFKDLYGLTPHQYLIELKMQKARQLLQKRQHTVTDVCYAVGFESVSSFSNLFKRTFDTSPSTILKESKFPIFNKSNGNL